MLSSDLGLTVVAVGLVTLAAALDLRDRKIPNWLIFAGTGAALLLRGLLGLELLRAGLVGTGIGLAVGYGLFALGVFGGGDGKLLMAVGACFGGPDRILGALLAIALAGGVLGILWAVREKVLLPLLLNTGRTMTYLLTLGRAGSLRTMTSPGAISVPYGVAIAAGSLIWWFWGVPVL